MTEPVWLDVELIKEIQLQLLAQFGGLEGIREEGYLLSALHRPQQLFAYEKPDFYQLAACYTHGLVKNHPFIDGNKRIGFMAAYTFLGVNGLVLRAAEEEAVIMTVDLAAGRIDVEVYAEWLRQNAEPEDA